MKGILSALLTVAIVVSISGCLGNQNNFAVLPSSTTTTTIFYLPANQPPQTTTTTQYYVPQNKTEATSTTLKNEPAVKPSTTSTTTPKSNVNVITDMAAVISSGLPYKCSFTYKEARSEAWIEGQRYLLKSDGKYSVDYALKRGDWTYYWREGEESGQKISSQEIQALSEKSKSNGMDLSASDPTYGGIQSIAERASNIECALTDVNGSVFNPPTQILFQDLGDILLD
ncbi:Uncharacterised protein [uncultured archaeon]|nr:Uncharacterised protein [uncultured archaeon]